MLIDWFTVGAQALNFLVLVWLLKRFLYKPILKAIDAREKLIAEKLAGAEAKMAEATKERDDYKHKKDDLDQHRATLVSDMEAETQTERQRLLNEARKAADALTAKRQASTKVDAQNLNLAIGHRLQQEVFAVARRALKDLSTSTLEQSVGTLFIRRVRDLNGTHKQVLAEALKTASGPAILRSAFELSAEQCAAMQQSLNETLSADIKITYEVSPDLISGIEFATNGQKISWSIAEYITSLESSVDDLLKMQTTQHAQPEVKREDNPEVRLEVRLEVKPEVKPEAKPEAKPDIASTPRAEKPADGEHARGP